MMANTTPESTNGSKPMRLWRAGGMLEKTMGYLTGVGDGERWMVVLKAEVDIDGERYIALEAKLAALNLKIVEKVSALLGDHVTVVVASEKQKEELLRLKETDGDAVELVFRAPRLKLSTNDSNANSINNEEEEEEGEEEGERKEEGEEDENKEVAASDKSSGQYCSVRDAANQFGIKSILGSNDRYGAYEEDAENDAVWINNGQGAIVIVWDETIPENAQAYYEFSRRPGGPVDFFKYGTPPDTDEPFSKHGGQVLSICCGELLGLASGASAVFLDTRQALAINLGIIEKIVQFERKKHPVEQRAIIVNMSWGFVFENVDGEIYRDITEFVAYIEKSMETLVYIYPRLVFVFAAGNDSENLCERGFDPMDFTAEKNDFDCENCYFWPEFGHSRMGNNEAFIRVAATDESGQYASYSNRGNCIMFKAHGNVCCLNVDTRTLEYTNGTSFSAPLFCSMLALYMTYYPALTGEEALKRLRFSLGVPLDEFGTARARLPPGLMRLDAVKPHPSWVPNNSDSSNIFDKIKEIEGSEGLISSLPSPALTQKEKDIIRYAIVIAICAVVATIVFFTFNTGLTKWDARQHHHHHEQQHRSLLNRDVR